jgi:hypothetical protein|tara:strand:- start:22 stop:495 length:474 start_codon:yes stop_codon:yes gene_type:complete
MKGLTFHFVHFIGQFIMTFDDDFYVVSSTSYIKSVPTNFCIEFLKELKNDDGTLKPHVEEIIENPFHSHTSLRMKQSIKATLPTCFVEIVYKHDGDTYLITHEVYLYEEDYPTYADLVAYKEKLAYGFASQVTQETKDIVEAFHNGYGCECLSSGDY